MGNNDVEALYSTDEAAERFSSIRHWSLGSLNGENQRRDC